MGYWTTNRGGASFSDPPASHPDMCWGDAPADLMSDALDGIAAAYQRDVGRLPTCGELRAGLEFALRAKPDSAVYPDGVHSDSADDIGGGDRTLHVVVALENTSDFPGIMAAEGPIVGRDNANARADDVCALLGLVRGETVQVPMLVLPGSIEDALRTVVLGDAERNGN